MAGARDGRSVPALPDFLRRTRTRANLLGSRITEAGCWAHVRRKFFDVHAATGSLIAEEALDRIAQLYGVEETIKGVSPDHRRRERQQRSKPIAAALAVWADETARQSLSMP